MITITAVMIIMISRPGANDLALRFIYPFLVSMIISALTFPGGPGKFMSADVNTHDQIHALFANYTWAQVTCN